MFILLACAEDPSGALCAPLEYHEVARVCSRLKPGTSGVLIDYEHISHAGSILWRQLFPLYRDFFQTHTVPENLKMGLYPRIQVFCEGRMVSVLRLSSRYACRSDLFRKYVYPTILVHT